MNIHAIMLLLVALALFVLLSVMSPRDRKETFDGAAPPLIEKRVAQVLAGMYDLTISSMINQNDINVTYKLWSSMMLKRGVPDEYVTSELFTKLRELTIAGKLNPAAVREALAPYYQKEVDEYRRSLTVSNRGINHVCSN